MTNDRRSARAKVWRMIAWFAIVYAVGFAFALGLQLAFHPPQWLLVIACFALGIVIPAPRWARWIQS